MCTYAKIYRVCANEYCRARYLYQTNDFPCEVAINEGLHVGHCGRLDALTDVDDYNANDICPECKARNETYRDEEKHRKRLYDKYVAKYGHPDAPHTVD